MSLRSTALAGAILLSGIAPAAAQSFSGVGVFGDSSVDAGAYIVRPNPGANALYNSLWAAAVAAGAGIPTSSPGLMNSQVLAAYFGLTANPYTQPGGTNAATSGAKNVTVNTGATGGFSAATPTVQQISSYLALFNGVASPNALYLISSGGNDISYALGQTGTGPFPSNPTAYMTGAANGLAAAIASLHAAGARYIIVPGLNYSFPIANTSAAATQRALELSYTQTLWSSIAAAGVNFIPADFNAVRLAIAANPSVFGFQFINTGPGQSACTQPAGITTAWALLCSSNPNAPSTFVAPNADQTHLFADDQHLTTAGQKIQADYYYSLIVAPSMVSILAETPLKTRAATIDTIYNHVTRGSERGQNGFNAWISADISSLSINNYPGFPADPNTPIYGTAGLDFGGDGWLAGAAVTFGDEKAAFAQNFGSFTQREFAMSAYGAYRAGPVWGTGIASAGTLRDAVNRTVPIGITLQNNSGGTTGSNYSVAGFVGYDMVHDWLTHGPLIGMTAQFVQLGGFTESGSFTSLAFGNQNRDSAVTALGYQASADFGMWRPFAQLVWNHETLSTDRQVPAALTTIAAPGYSMPAVMLGKDWATGMIGTTFSIGHGVTALMAFRGQIAQDSAAVYGGQLGLSVAF